MHPDASLLAAVSPATEPDIEPQNNQPPEVTSRCTEVCGDGLPARSCAKICLVQVFRQGQRERSVKMYAILDDQSNRSLARAEFFQPLVYQRSVIVSRWQSMESFWGVTFHLFSEAGENRNTNHLSLLTSSCRWVVFSGA